MHFLHIPNGRKIILITGKEHSHRSSEFWPAISRRELKYLSPYSGTKNPRTIMFSFVLGAVSEGLKSGCKSTDSLVPVTDVILAQVKQWFHGLAFTLITPGGNSI